MSRDGRIQWVGRESGRLTDQRTLPNAKQQFLELSEVLRAKFGASFALDLAEHIQNIWRSERNGYRSHQYFWARPRFELNILRGRG